uniref:Uncharacterized protein n=1 Tax=Anguilla anguilla TaxID=7936 RepID=A0A0E9WZY9_ANGAN
MTKKMGIQLYKSFESVIIMVTIIIVILTAVQFQKELCLAKGKFQSFICSIGSSKRCVQKGVKCEHFPYVTVNSF